MECAGAPAKVTAAGELNAVSLSWAPGPGAEPTAYYVVVGDGRVLRVDAPASGMRVDGLRNGVAVDFTLHAATAGGVGPGVSASGTPTSGMEGEVAGLVVKYAEDVPVSGAVPGASSVSAVGLSDGGEVAADVRKVDFSEATSLATAQAVAEQLEASPEVVWAEPDQFVFSAGESVSATDLEFAQQRNLWDAYGIDAPVDGTSGASSFAGAGSGVRVAVVDTGVVSHPDLDGALVPGYDFVSDPPALAAPREPGGAAVQFDADGQSGWDADATDPGDWRGVAPARSSTWHGTQMAGLIAARSGDGGMVGVAPSASVQPVRALSWRGGLLSDVAAAITWASGGSVAAVPDNPMPSQVVSLSFAVEASCPASLQSAIDGAVARGSVVVAAAGNAGSDSAGFAPANCANVIGVGASDRAGKRASYSNWGSAVDLSAPGGSLASDGGVRTASNSGTSAASSPGYGFAEGTSVAAAQVSGAVARMLSSSSGASLTPAAVATALTGSAVKAFAGSSCDADASRTCGAGILSLAQVASVASGDVDYALTLSGDAASPQYATYAPAGTSIFDLTGALTIEAWVYPTSNAGEQLVVNKEEAYELGIVDGTWRYAMATVNASGTVDWAWIDTGIAPRLDQWQHIALTRVAGTDVADFYVDGQWAAKKVAGSAGTGAIATSSLPFTIGGRSGSTLPGGGYSYFAPFAGRIDEVRVWDVARPVETIVEDMHTYGPVGESGLVAYYDMNEAAGTGQAFNRATTASTEPALSIVGAGRTDIKSTSADGSVLTFPRSYLTKNGGWKAPADVNVEYLVVAGGGAGGASHGGGGGGGGVRATDGSLTAGQSYRVTVGAGGAASLDHNAGVNGGDSWFGTTQAIGGGGGGSYRDARQGPVAGSAGGSGGGGGGVDAGGTGGSGTASQGFDGGAGNSGTGMGAGGGGGGAVGAGNAASGYNGGHGGNGREWPIGSGTLYGGGGGGGGWVGTGYEGDSGSGGLGGGGRGGDKSVWVSGKGSPGFAGNANAGGGGGGGADYGSGGGAGGSGVVILRYAEAETSMQLSYTVPAGASVGLPLRGTVAVIVNWGDGSSTTTVNGTDVVADTTHTFASAGTYNVTIGRNPVRAQSPWLSRYGTGDPQAPPAGQQYLTSVARFGYLGVSSFSTAFAGASSLVDVPAYLPGSVETIDHMFFQASSINDADISAWDVSGVTNIHYAFASATAFNQPLDNWNVANVTRMDGLFYAASAFDQSLASWQTNAVTRMDFMFYEADAFQGDISGWQVTGVTDMTSFLKGAGFPQAIYDKVLVSWGGQAVQTGLSFDAGSSVYCSDAAAAGRAALLAKSWTITDVGRCASRLKLTTAATGWVAGADQTVTIKAIDASGTVATAYAGSKVVRFSGPGAGTSSPSAVDSGGTAIVLGADTTITFTNGEATAFVTLTKAESTTLNVTDGSLDSSGAGDGLAVLVAPGDASSFAVSLDATQTYGTAFTGTNTITAKDNQGNTVTSFDASTTPVTVTTAESGDTISGLGSAGGAVLNRASDFVNGVASLTGKLVYRGTAGATGTAKTLTATNGGLTGSASFTLKQGAPSGLTYQGTSIDRGDSGSVDPTLTSAGGAASLKYSAVGSLPTGLTLDPDSGRLSYDSTLAAGVHSVTVKVENAVGSTQGTASITVAGGARTITVSGDATFTYNGLSQGPAGYSLNPTGTSGAVSFSYYGKQGTTSYDATTTPPTAAGTYLMTATVAATPKWDAATSQPFEFIIQKKALMVTAVAQSVPYGTAASSVTGAGSVQYSGFASGDSTTVVSGSPSFTTTYTATTPAGTAGVTITPVVTGLSAANYTFTAVTGTVTVTKATITTSWDSTPTAAYRMTYPLSFSVEVQGIEASDFTNAGTATACVFETSASSGTSVNVHVTGCSAGSVKPRLAAGSVQAKTNAPSYESIAQADGGSVTLTSTGATPAYPSVSVKSGTASGKALSPIEIGDFSIGTSAITGCGWSSVRATVTPSAGTVDATAGAATKSGSGTNASPLVLEGSVAAVAAALDSVTLTHATSGTVTVSTSIVPSVTFTSGSSTYHFNSTNGHYYTQSSWTHTTRHAAASMALSQTLCGAGGYLATFKNSAEFGFIRSVFPQDAHNMWVGGLKVAGTWRWQPGPNAPAEDQGLEVYAQSGSPWHDKEPNNSGSDMQIFWVSGVGYGWDDTTDKGLQASLVEFGNNATFTPSSTDVTVTVGKAEQSALSITSTGGTFGTPLTLTTSGGSSTGSVGFTYVDGSASGCSVTGGVLTSSSHGTCVVTAKQSGDATYLDVTSADTTVTFARRTLTVTADAQSVVYGTAVTTVTGAGSAQYSGFASGDSTTLVSGSLSFTTTYTSSTPAGTAGVTITPVVTGLSAENYTFTAVARTVTVTRAPGSASLAYPATMFARDATVTPGTSSHAGDGLVTFARDANDASICSVDPGSGVVTMLAPGDCRVTMSVAEGTNHLAASVVATLAIGKADQSALSITSTSGTFGTPLTLTTSGGSSTGSVQFTPADGTASGCSVSDGVLTSSSHGTCVVTAKKLGDANYLDVTSAGTTVTFARRTLTVTASSPSVGFGGSFAPSVSTGAGQLVGSDAVSGATFAYAGTGATSYAASTTKPTAVGTYSVTPSAVVFSSGSAGNYDIGYVAGTLTISKAGQVLAFTSAAPADAVALGTYQPAVSSTSAVTGGASGLAPVLSISDASSSVCSISASGVVTFDQPGTCVVAASHSGSASFDAAATVSQSIVVGKAPQAIAFAQPAEVPVGAGSLTLTASASSGLPVTFVLGTGSEAGVCTVSAAGVVSLLAPGTCAVEARQAGDSSYAAADPVTRAFGVLAPPKPPPIGPDINAQDPPAGLLDGTVSLAVFENGTLVAGSGAGPNAELSGWQVWGPSFSMEVSAARPGGGGVPLGQGNSLTGMAGGSIEVRASGYLGGSMVRVFLVPVLGRSLPWLAPRALVGTLFVGEGRVAADGTFDASFAMPAAAGAGRWILQVNGVTAGDRARSIGLAMQVVAPQRAAVQRAGFFAPRSADLTALGKAKLQALVNAVPADAVSVDVQVVGVSVSAGSVSGNASLAQARADRLVDELVALGLDADAVDVTSGGAPWAGGGAGAASVRSLSTVTVAFAA